MPKEVWLYYVPLIVTQKLGQVGHSVRLYPAPKRLDSQEAVIEMIDRLAAEVFPDGPPDLPDGMLPVVPFNFVLLTAKQSQD